LRGTLTSSPSWRKSRQRSIRRIQVPKSFLRLPRNKLLFSCVQQISRLELAWLWAFFVFFFIMSFSDAACYVIYNLVSNQLYIYR
jgi:hypothetical protein